MNRVQATKQRPLLYRCFHPVDYIPLPLPCSRAHPLRQPKATTKADALCHRLWLRKFGDGLEENTRSLGRSQEQM